MIHKIKAYEIRSHGFVSKASYQGQLLSVPNLFDNYAHFNKAYVRRAALHLQELLKCIKQIEKENKTKEALTIIKDSTPGQEANK